MSAVRRLFALHAESERCGTPVEELRGTREGRDGTYTRRGLMLGGAGLLAGAALAGHPLRSAARALPARAPRVAIVGSRLAGLRCAVRRLAAVLALKLEIVNGGDLPSGEEAHRIGKLLLANTVTENGGDPGDQSALDLIEITAKSPRIPLELLPGDDEKFHVLGGNDQLVSGMIAQLPPATVKHGHRLVALRANADETSTLSFDTGAGTVDVTADYVVLALPFSTLRDVDLSQSGLSATKQSVIQTFGMGTNAKVHVELARKTWPALGFAGAAYGEWDRFCCAWDDSVPLGADASPALLLGFPGGDVGNSGLTGEAHAAAPGADVEWFLGEIEPVYPGTAAAYSGRAYEDHWALDPWAMGAYSYYRVGQAATYARLAAAPEGRIHFAGEHTSRKFQGFLEGAVISGERAARQLLGKLGSGRG
jgi:monoamine oxidase